MGAGAVSSSGEDSDYKETSAAKSSKDDSAMARVKVPGWRADESTPQMYMERLWREYVIEALGPVHGRVKPGELGDAFASPEGREEKARLFGCTLGNFMPADLKKTKVLRQLLGFAHSAEWLAHKEAVYLYRKRKALFALKAYLTRTPVSKITAETRRRRYGIPPEGMMEKIDSGEAAVWTLEQLYEAWPQPFLHTEVLWEEVYVKEFREVFVERLAGTAKWQEFLSPVSRDFLGKPSAFVKGVLRIEGISGYVQEVPPGNSPLERTDNQLRALGLDPAKPGWLAPSKPIKGTGIVNTLRQTQLGERGLGPKRMRERSEKSEEEDDLPNWKKQAIRNRVLHEKLTIGKKLEKDSTVEDLPGEKKLKLAQYQRYVLLNELYMQSIKAEEASKRIIKAERKKLQALVEQTKSLHARREDLITELTGEDPVYDQGQESVDSEQSEESMVDSDKGEVGIEVEEDMGEESKRAQDINKVGDQNKDGGSKGRNSQEEMQEKGCEGPSARTRETEQVLPIRIRGLLAIEDGSLTGEKESAENKEGKMADAQTSAANRASKVIGGIDKNQGHMQGSEKRAKIIHVEKRSMPQWRIDHSKKDYGMVALVRAGSKPPYESSSQRKWREERDEKKAKQFGLPLVFFPALKRKMVIPPKIACGGFGKSSSVYSKAIDREYNIWEVIELNKWQIRKERKEKKRQAKTKSVEKR